MEQKSRYEISEYLGTTISSEIPENAVPFVKVQNSNQNFSSNGENPLPSVFDTSVRENPHTSRILNYYESFWISGLLKVEQGSHIIMVLSPFTKSSVFFFFLNIVHIL